MSFKKHYKLKKKVWFVIEDIAAHVIVVLVTLK